MMTKDEILEKVYSRLSDIQIMLDEEAVSDTEIDKIYGIIASAVDMVEHSIFVNREVQ
jgi:hypothetical protein